MTRESATNARKRRMKILRNIHTYFWLTVLGAIFTIPFLWLLTTSFKPNDRIQRWPPDIIPMQHVRAVVDGKSRKVYDMNGQKVALMGRVKPGVAKVKYLDKDNKPVGGIKVVGTDSFEDVMKPGFSGRNYKDGLNFGKTVEEGDTSVWASPFFTQLKNTIIICLFAVFGTVLSSSLVAYGLSRINWKGRDTLFTIIISTMMLPGQVTMIPIFAIFVWLGWIDTFLPLIVPTFLGNAFFIFLLKQFFMTIPQELSEAARIDGCSEWQIYTRVIMPLTKPALATVGLFTFMNTWNDFMGPLIYLVDESKYTLSLGLSMFMGQYGSQYGMMMAISTLVTIPIVIMFFFTQKTFIQGITMSGIKGYSENIRGAVFTAPYFIRAQWSGVRECVGKADGFYNPHCGVGFIIRCRRQHRYAL